MKRVPKPEPFDQTKERCVQIKLSDAKPGQVSSIFVRLPQAGRNPRKQLVSLTIDETLEWCLRLQRAILSAKHQSTLNRINGATGRTIDDDEHDESSLESEESS